MISLNGSKRALPISLMDLNTGEVIAFGSGTEAATHLGCTPGDISHLRSRARRRIKNWVLAPGVPVQRATSLRAPVHLINLETLEVMRFESCKAADAFLGCPKGGTSSLRRYRRNFIGNWTLYEEDLE